MSGMTKEKKVDTSAEGRKGSLEGIRRSSDYLTRLGAVDSPVLVIQLPEGSVRWVPIDYLKSVT
jgi:hypothetical protein